MWASTPVIGLGAGCGQLPVNLEHDWRPPNNKAIANRFDGTMGGTLPKCPTPDVKPPCYPRANGNLPSGPTQMALMEHAKTSAALMNLIGWP